MANYVPTSALREIVSRQAAYIPDSYLRDRLDEWEEMATLVLGTLPAGNALVKRVIREGAKSDVQRKMYEDEFVEEEPPSVAASQEHAERWLDKLDQMSLASDGSETPVVSDTLVENITELPVFDVEEGLFEGETQMEVTPSAWRWEKWRR